MEHPLGNISVLIVDDTFAHQQTLQNVLKNIGFSNCTAVADGQAAEQTFLNGNIDLVISEIKLPKMSGIQLFESLIRTALRDANKPLRYIFFTGFGSEENVKSILKISESFTPDEKKMFKYDLILKPLRVDKLISKLQNVFADNSIIKKHLDGELSKLG